MTYEKFEDKVIEMLLKGDDPRLKKLNEQLAVGDVLSREETSMGFVTAFSAPSELAINGLVGHISGVEVQLSDFPLVNVELTVKDGIVDELKASYATEMTYTELIEAYHELTFVYTNGQSSDLSFRLESQTSKAPEPVMVEESVELLEVEPAIEDLDHDLASNKTTIIPNVEDLERIIAKLDTKEEDGLEDHKAELVEDNFSNESNNDDFEEIVAEIVGNEVLLSSESVEANEVSIEPSSSAHESLIDDVLKNYQKKTVEDQSKLDDSIMLPPSFSIPKVPDAIKERWSNSNETASTSNPNQINQEEDLKQEILTQILNQKESTSSRVAVKVKEEMDVPAYKETFANRNTPSSEKYYESNVGLSELLDGKAPQGSGSFVRKPVVTSEPVSLINETQTPNPSPIVGDENISTRIKENFEFKNLTPKELSNTNLKMDYTATIEPELLESIALSETDEQQMNRDIARMEMAQRSTEVKIAAIFIILGIICILGFIFIALF